MALRALVRSSAGSTLSRLAVQAVGTTLGAEAGAGAKAVSALRQLGAGNFTPLVSSRLVATLPLQQAAGQPEPVADGLPTDLEAPDHGRKYGDEGFVAMHKGMQPTAAEDYWLMQPVYSKEYVESVLPTHKPPTKLHEKVGYHAIQAVRKTFDFFTNYGPNMTEADWMRRIIFLETVAGVPGMVGGMLRHMRSLRSMQRDHGWIHTLLEEAENERMHLLTFLQMRQPGPIFRGTVLLAQGVFFNAYMLAYILSPRTCHAAVGYLEEEAVKTYTHAIRDLEQGKLPEWTAREVPAIAKRYWKLEDDASMRDLLLAVRADEACHSHVNHTFSEMKADKTNPFAPGSTMVQ